MNVAASTTKQPRERDALTQVVRGRRLTRYFRRLRWKLTASYTLVTVAVLLVLELLAILAVSVVVVLLLSQHGDLILNELEDETARELGPYFASDVPDRAGIDAWLKDAERNGIRLQGSNVVISASDLTQPGTQLIVVDSNGQVLGALGQIDPPATLRPLNTATVPDLGGLLPQALAGEPSSTPFIAWPIPDHLTAAVPIRDDSGAVRGALVFTGSYDFLQDPLVALGPVLIASVVVFTIAAGFVGTIFGYFTARGLTRRLDRMSAVAAAWGAGNFTRQIEDASPDEIGQLARQFNRMAEQVEDVIATREQFSVVDERNRLARDLHDSVKQQAFAISMNLGAARSLWERDPAAARARIDTAFDIARQSQQDLAAIIQTLRPVQLEQTDIRQALPEYVETWQAQASIQAACEVEGEAELPRQVEDALFRVAQEALANAARHSRATAVTVRVRLDPEATELRVQDNGRGFDARRIRPGLGLHSMRERVEALGGTFTIESGVGGTSVTVRIPLALEDRSQS